MWSRKIRLLLFPVSFFLTFSKCHYNFQTRLDGTIMGNASLEIEPMDISYHQYFIADVWKMLSTKMV